MPSLVPQGAHDGKRPMTLNRLFTLIGSAPSARLYLPSKSVSRCHAVIINGDTGFFVRDLASRTQVIVNGRPVREADLRDGDVLQIGPFTFRFTDPSGQERPAPVPPTAALLEAEGLSEPLRLEERLVLIGRRETADISLTENSASSAHAVLIATGGGHVMRDLHSRTGTFVNDAKIHEQVLQPGDVLRVGETTMRYARARNHPVAVPAAPATPAASKAPQVQAGHAAPAPPAPPAVPSMPTPTPPVAPTAAPETTKPAQGPKQEPGQGRGHDSKPATIPVAAEAPAEAESGAAIEPPAEPASEAADASPLVGELTGQPAREPAGDGDSEHVGAKGAPPAPSKDAAPALAEGGTASEEGSSLGVGAYLDSLSGATRAGAKSEGTPAPRGHPEAAAADDGARVAPTDGQADAASLASTDDLFDDSPDRTGSPVEMTSETDDSAPTEPAHAGASPAELAEPSASVPSPAVPSPAVPSPALPSPDLSFVPDLPDVGGVAEGGEAGGESSEPATAAAAYNSTLPGPPPLPPPHGAAPAAPAALPIRPAWGNRARAFAPPGTATSPRQGASAGAGWSARTAPPAPPAPPPSALPGNRAATARPLAPRKPVKSPRPARPERPQSPADLTPASGATGAESLSDNPNPAVEGDAI